MPFQSKFIHENFSIFLLWAAQEKNLTLELFGGVTHLKNNTDKGVCTTVKDQDSKQ